MKNRNLNDKGQASIESLFSFSIILSSLFLALAATYLVLIKFWLDFHSYQANLCLLTYNTKPKQCHLYLERKIHTIWPQGQLIAKLVKKKIKHKFLDISKLVKHGK